MSFFFSSDRCILHVTRFLSYNITRICAVVGCSSSTYQLQKWRSGFCSTHNCSRASSTCTCPEPFRFILFRHWKKNLKGGWSGLNLSIVKIPKQGKTGSQATTTGCAPIILWKDNQPRNIPVPLLILVTQTSRKKHQVRAARKARTIQQCTKYSPAEKRLKLRRSKLRFTVLFRAKMLTIYNVNHDHNHIHVCDCAHICMCPGCHRKEKTIVKLQLELEEVKTENVLHK